MSIEMEEYRSKLKNFEIKAKRSFSICMIGSSIALFILAVMLMKPIIRSKDDTVDIILLVMMSSIFIIIAILMILYCKNKRVVIKEDRLTYYNILGKEKELTLSDISEVLYEPGNNDYEYLKVRDNFNKQVFLVNNGMIEFYTFYCYLVENNITINRKSKNLAASEYEIIEKDKITEKCGTFISERKDYLDEWKLKLKNKDIDFKYEIKEYLVHDDQIIEYNRRNTDILREGYYCTFELRYLKDGKELKYKDGTKIFTRSILITAAYSHRVGCNEIVLFYDKEVVDSEMRAELKALYKLRKSKLA